MSVHLKKVPSPRFYILTYNQEKWEEKTFTWRHTGALCEPRSTGAEFARLPACPRLTWPLLLVLALAIRWVSETGPCYYTGTCSHPQSRMCVCHQPWPPPLPALVSSLTTGPEGPAKDSIAPEATADSLHCSPRTIQLSLLQTGWPEP